MKKLNTCILTGWLICVLCASCSVDQQFEFPLGPEGDNGKSAYELWKEDVARGLDDPRTDEVDEWPKTDITLADFWLYLRGKDGGDGEDGIPGTTGIPGSTVTVIAGKYNVIAQYSLQEASEFVRWTDGAVEYVVYDKTGNLLPGTEVSNMPGVNSGLTFTSDVNGKFVITKDQLPKGVSAADRFGSATVNGETTARNTYVPEKIDIRLRMNSANPFLGGSQEVRVRVIVERRTAVGSPWAVVPSYLSGVSTGFTGYLLTKDNPGVMTANGTTTQNISSTALILTAARPRVRSKNVPDYWENQPINNVWDWTTRYFTWKLNNYYGESAQLLAYQPDGDYSDEVYAYIEKTPIQRVPIIQDVKMSQIDDVGGIDAALLTEGSLDISDVNYDYIYKPDDANVFSRDDDENNRAWFTAVPMSEEEANAEKIFVVGFLHKDGGSGTTENISTGTGPEERLGLKDNWVLSGVVYDKSDVYVSCTNTNYFLGVALVERFTFGKVSFTDKKINPAPSVDYTYPASVITPIPITFEL